VHGPKRRRGFGLGGFKVQRRFGGGNGCRHESPRSALLWTSFAFEVERETAAPGRTDRPSELEIRGAWNDHSRGRNNGRRHGTRDDTVRDRQSPPSATWGLSRGLGHRWLKNARPLCCHQCDKCSRNPSFLFKILLRIFGIVPVLELGIEPGASVNVLSMSTSDDTMTSLSGVA
jgi:hypothetical protein